MGKRHRKPWTEKRRATLSEDLDLLLGDLCAQWGFCNRLSGEDLVREHPIITGESFATAVLNAEGMSPLPHGEHWEAIKSVFCRRYGHAVSDKDYVPDL
jgi:hypothetical protein